MLGHVGSRNDTFRERDPVIGKEVDLKQPAHVRIVIYDARDIVDEFDDEFCHVITGGRFSSEKNGARNKTGTLAGFYVIVKRNTLEDLESLAFILVHAFYLDVEQGIRV